MRELAPLALIWLVGLGALESRRSRLDLTAPWSLACFGRLAAPPLAVAGSALLALLALRRWPSALALLVLAPAWWLASPLGSTWLDWATAGTAFLALQRYLLRRGRASVPERRLETNLGPLRWAAWWGCAAALLVPDELALARLLWLPPLLGLLWGAENAVFRIEAEQAEEARGLFHRTQDDLRRALWERDRVWQEARATAEQRAQVAELQARMRAANSLYTLIETLAQQVGPGLRLRSFALYVAAPSQEEQALVCHSPEKSFLETFPLWGDEKEKQVNWADPLPRMVTRPWLADEPQAVLIPWEGCLLYLGRAQPWQNSEFLWLGSLLEQFRPWFRSHFAAWSQQKQLQSLQARSQFLSHRLDSLNYLVHCAEQLAGSLQPEVLWERALDCLGSALNLEMVALLEPELTACRGPAPDPAIQEWAFQIGQVGYLAQQDRTRWPVRCGYENLLTLPLGERERLLLAFRGPELLTPTQLDALQGLARLLGSSFSRARLYRQLEESKDLWLQTHKGLALAQLAAGIAHELNSPLGAIQLALEASMLQAQALSARLTPALQACQKARAIIARLGELSLQENEEQKSVDVVQLIRTLLQQLRDLPAVRLEGPETLVYPAPREELERLLLPVLLNAVEALQGQGVLSIHWGQKEGEIFVSVHDTGPGVPPELRARVAEPFFTSKEIGKHLGLGLASMDQACRRLGGRWQMESIPEREGTRVTWVLPLARAAVAS